MWHYHVSGAAPKSVEAGNAFQFRWWIWLCRPDFVLQQELDEMKLKVDSAVTSLWDLKVEVQKVKEEYVVIAAVCVGRLMTNIWK